MDSIACRIQDMPLGDQAIILSRIAETRSEAGLFAPLDIVDLFDELGLPRPSQVSNILAKLEREARVTRPRTTRGQWKLTPVGRRDALALLSDMDLAALLAEAQSQVAPTFGRALHPTISPVFAPPELLGPMRGFLEHHPFETNVFGMTRFPDEQDDAGPDPVLAAVAEARDACGAHGLTFHLASDRAIVDDLWGNVAAHMWASRYGIAFFEDRRARGINYNLTVEVGGMLIMGRRCALLKDDSIECLPTDLVGKIYRGLDIDDPAAVRSELHGWLRDDLSLGKCPQCE